MKGVAMRFNRVMVCLSVPTAFALLTCTHVPETAVVQRTYSEEVFLTIGQQYKGYGRVNDVPRLAPIMCGPGVVAGSSNTPAPMSPQLSRSAGGTPHGQKRFYLYASDKEAYRVATGAEKSSGGV